MPKLPKNWKRAGKIRASGSLREHHHGYGRRKDRTRPPGTGPGRILDIHRERRARRVGPVMILVPVKNLSWRKTTPRFVVRSADTHRARASHAVRCARNSGRMEGRPEVGIVTSDPFALQLAQQFRFSVIPDNNNRSQTDAIEMATRFCESQGIDNTLVIPGDIPLFRIGSWQRFWNPRPAKVPSWSAPPMGAAPTQSFDVPLGLFPARFGNDSFEPHHAAAQATGQPCVLLSLPGIALDIDNPSDLRALAAAPGETHAQRLIRQWQLDDLPQAANE